MENKKFFSMIEPSDDLKGSIIKTIKKEEMRKAIYRIVLGSLISVASTATVILLASNIIKDAYQSGLSEYLSLLFSDGATLISYWQTYVMSIIESLPIIQITAVLISLWIFIWSANMILISIKGSRFIYKTN